jgi:hypothetical protein
MTACADVRAQVALRDAIAERARRLAVAISTTQEGVHRRCVGEGALQAPAQRA